jgi:hypothetical protein
MMNFQWGSFHPYTKEVVMTEMTLKLERMITQGFSNVLYGLGQLGLDWSSVKEPFVLAVTRSCIRAFSNKDIKGRDDSSQGIANIIYSMGTMSAKWDELPKEMTDALGHGIELYCDELSSQEVSNSIYG